MSSPFERMADAIIQGFMDESSECARRWMAETNTPDGLPDETKELCISAFQIGYINAIRNHVLRNR